jgi:hypothetical protein
LRQVILFNALLIPRFASYTDIGGINTNDGAIELIF